MMFTEYQVPVAYSMVAMAAQTPEDRRTQSGSSRVTGPPSTTFTSRLRSGRDDVPVFSGILMVRFELALRAGSAFPKSAPSPSGSSSIWHSDNSRKN